MPIEEVPGTDLSSYLIAYDSAGRERTDDPGGSMSQAILNAIVTQPITDVFVMSHGWKGDVPAAREQYRKWIRAMADCAADLSRVRRSRPGFKSLIVGIHWASQPWGDEELGAGAGAAFSSTVGNVAAARPKSIAELVDAYAERLADTPEARRALGIILGTAARDVAPAEMPVEVRDAYKVLEHESQLDAAGEGSAPGRDHAAFDPEAMYFEAQSLAPASFGSPSVGDLLSPLRQLSFWKMKDRARRLGETAGSALLRSMQLAVPARRAPEVHFHLMGHSFGCIVVSAMLHDLPRPVDSLTLVQGALSLWSYCSDIPQVHGTPGYFRRLIEQRTVNGPIITTQSRFDTAVGKFYPLGAGFAGQTAFAPPGAPDRASLPMYGGLGTFGVQGPGLDIVPLEMHAVTDSYEFEARKIYNLDGSRFICHGSGASGAHSDIALPEVAHAMWSAVCPR